MIQEIPFRYEIVSDVDLLASADALLIKEARLITDQSYAPYSNFHVAAAGLLMNGAIVRGTNQENASYPVSICAERVLLSAAASLYPGIALVSMAISYRNLKGSSNRPITPCGVCRQSLVEHQHHFHKSIRLLLTGQIGEIYIIEDAASLLPLGFTADDMK
ncbi:MAG: cytidine deaminase [Chitinophagia bacterium]|nr:cytidine deaminase [Chitinophagia bacterium]